MYEKLISDLREYAEWAEANKWEVPIMLSDHLKQAADAIEKMQNLLDGISANNDSFCEKKEEGSEGAQQ